MDNITENLDIKSILSIAKQYPTEKKLVKQFFTYVDEQQTSDYSKQLMFNNVSYILQSKPTLQSSTLEYAIESSYQFFVTNNIDLTDEAKQNLWMVSNELALISTSQNNKESINEVIKQTQLLYDKSKTEPEIHTHVIIIWIVIVAIFRLLGVLLKYLTVPVWSGIFLVSMAYLFYQYRYLKYKLGGSSNMTVAENESVKIKKSEDVDHIIARKLRELHKSDTNDKK